MKMNRSYAGSVLSCLALFVAGGGESARAATTNVSVSSFMFTPPTVSINVNDTVQWNWGGTLHTSTSVPPPPQGLWNSGNKSSGSFSFTFASSGNFPYNCTLHPSLMAGSVIVASANQPPSVSITNPANGATFAAPWTGTIKAAASDPDPGGSVTKVEFFTNSVSAGSVTTAPYNLTVNNVAAGSYTLTAVATDNGGATTTSAAVTVSVVTPVAIVITNSQRLSVTQFRLTYSANAGLRYVVERSALLTDFAGIDTNTAASNSVTFTDGAAGDVQNFYRVGRLPNP